MSAVAGGPPFVEPVLPKPSQEPARSEERTRLIIAPAVLAIVVLALGLYLPTPLADALASSAASLGGHAP